MRADTPELLFKTRVDFRSWLSENSENSEGVWLVFSKTRNITTLTANEALEEALCFGWIDGVMKSIDDTKYRKYFAKRRANSVWSEKNKKLIEALRGKNIMTELGERAVSEAVKNGQWDKPKNQAVTDDQIAIISDLLKAHKQAYTNYQNMPASVKRTYAKAYLDARTEAGRKNRLAWMIDRLNKNLRPM